MSINKIQGSQIQIKDIRGITRNLSADENYSVIYYFNNLWRIGKLPVNNLNDVAVSGNTSSININIKGVEIGRRNNNTILIGNLSLKDNDTGAYIISIGDNSLEKNVSGNNLVVIGHNSYTSSTNKNDIVVLGNNTAKNNKGQNLVLIGNKIEFSSETVNDSIIIGNNLNLDEASGKLIIGTSNSRILLLGDFVNKKLEIKGGLKVTNEIIQSTINEYDGSGATLLVRNSSGEYQSIPNPTKNATLKYENGHIFWQEENDDLYDIDGGSPSSSYDIIYESGNPSTNPDTIIDGGII